MKIPFKVSARTARLIGRENVANSEGALIELVKNSYDADASVCVVFIDNKYNEIPLFLTNHEYLTLSQRKGAPNNFEEIYQYDKSQKLYTYNPESVSDIPFLEKFFQKQCRVFIFDNGEGMNDFVIKNHWMTIGTNNKQENFKTGKKGRIKAGEKGIGRFALDRIGGFCLMQTKPDPEVHEIPNNVAGYKWKVLWDEFEGPNKHIDDVGAELDILTRFDLTRHLKRVLKNNYSNDLSSHDFSHGTAIKISKLRDMWGCTSVSKLFSNLEILVPPREEREFDIYVFSSAEPDRYGRVEGSVCDDFDYKIHAKSDRNKNVTIEIVRNEINLHKLDKRIFERKKMQKYPYDYETFKGKNFKLDYTLSELVPGFEDVDKQRSLSKIGPFEFIFYFMKRSSGREEAKRFYYKDFNARSRQRWLDQFGGIKIFRDNFRVRPYGERNSNAFDWLGLGSRHAASPAGVAKKSGGYRVRPYNLSGSIHISRMTNLAFEDKSSREGLQENQEFEVFKNLVLGIIHVFEADRSYIARELNALYEDQNKQEEIRKKAEEISDRIKREKEKGQERDHEKSILAEHLEQQKGIIDELRDEQKLLRALASAGAITVSFTHELQNLKGKLISRFDELKSIINPLLDKSKLSALPDYLDPYIYIDDIKRQDERIKHWLDFSLNSLKKDKRKRKSLDIYNYLTDFKDSWSGVLSYRKIDLKISSVNAEEFKQRFFEIDLDTIFNNLLVNSFDAFQRPSAPENRDINISIVVKDDSFEFIYEDTGPGLSPDIKDREQIFECFFTTKRHKQTGEDIGTGIGMWLVNSTVNDYDGVITFLDEAKGFGLKMEFPIKHKRKS